MTNDFESDKKYVPYKEIVKKRALDYYYANKEVISEKSKVGTNPCHLNRKRKGKRILKDG